MPLIAPIPDVRLSPDEPASNRPGRSSALLGLRITFGGLLYVLILVLICLAALNSEANLLLLLCGIGAGVLLISVFAPMRMVRGVTVERLVPQRVVAGRSFRVTYVVRSRRSWGGVYSIVVSEAAGGERRSGGVGRSKSVRMPSVFFPFLGAGAEARAEHPGLCTRRGVVNLPALRITSRFPFGLFSCSAMVRHPAVLHVYPAVGQFRADPWRSRGNATAVSRQRSIEHAQDDEFYGLREYRQGDNLRWIHWRRSAHMGELLVREMARVRSPQMIVLLDPWPDGAAATKVRARRSSQAPPLDVPAETLISTAATLICDALERGHRVGLVCRAREPVVIAPAGGRPHRRRLMEALALIEPGPCEPFDQLVPAVRWPAGWQAKCAVLATHLDERHERVGRFLGRRAEALLMLSANTRLDMLAPGPELPVAAAGGGAS
jgi:uncharacterized protein (DUF58 family)